MGDETATGRLREGLTARGMEYETNDDYRLPNDPPQTTWTSTIAGDLLTVTASEDNGYLGLELHELVTPEQAIAATAGAGTCEDACADLSQLRDYVERKGTLHHFAELSGQVANLSAENERLRGHIARDGTLHHVMDLSGQVASLEAENARLRELVRDMWPSALRGYDLYCDVCPWDDCGICDARKPQRGLQGRMRELGIEVPE